MAAVWARAEVILDANGELLPAQVRRAATRAGIEGGRAASASFTRSFGQGAGRGLDSAMGEALKKVSAQFSLGGAWDKMFTRSGQELGRSFVKGFGESTKTFRLEFDEFRRIIRGLGGDMDRLAIGPGFVDDIGELHQVFEDTDESVRRTSDGFTILWRELEAGTPTINKVTDALNDNTESVKRSSRFWEIFNKSSNKMIDTWKKIGGGGGGGGGGILGDLNSGLEHHGSIWKNLSHNTRQWTLIIGAVIGGMGQLAGLASAAGSGLFVLAGALSGLVTGAGFMVVAFTRFLGDLEKVPEAVRPAREAFDEFGKTFGEVMGEMTVHAFKDTERAWKHFGEVVVALQPGFNAIGDVVNKLITDLSDNLDTTMVENLNGFLEGSARILDRVTRAIGRVGEALLIAFNNPQFQQSLGEFLGWIDLITDRFAAFLTGPGFDEWLEHGRSVFGAFGALLDTTGRLLNDLVTDETIGQLVAFIENIDRFLQGGGKGILDFAQELDIFGLLAKGLADFGDALEPLAGPMKDFAEGLNDVVESGIDTLAPIIEDIAEALAPFVQGIANFMKENPKGVADALIAIGGAFLILKGAKVGMAAIDMLAFSTSMTAGGTAIRRFDVAKLGKIGSGLAGIGLIAAGTLIPESFWDQFNIESHLPQSVLTGAGIGAMIVPGWGIPIGAALGLVYSLFTEFELTMNDVGLNLVGLFVGGPFGQAAGHAAEFFAGLVPDEWATSDNPFERFVSEFATNVEEFGTTLTTVAEEVGKLFDGSTEDVGEFELAMNTFFENQKTAWDTWTTDLTTNWDTMWTTLQDPAKRDALAIAIGTWLGEQYTKWETWGTDVLSSWTTTWDTLDDPKFWDGIAVAIGTWLDLIKTYFSTKLSEAKGAWDLFWGNLPAAAQGSASIIKTETSNLVRDASNTLKLMPSYVGAQWDSFWGSLSGAVEDAYWDVVHWVGLIIAAAQSAASASSGVSGGHAKAPSNASAAGGLFFGPSRRLIGEAGPEAVVPLNRSLMMVDPSVRWLSAIAQGKAPGMASGGIVGGGRTLTIENINVNEVGDSRRTANDVIERFAEYVNG